MRRVRSHKRYVGITWSSRRGKTSLIFKLQIVQGDEVGLYTTMKVQKELRLVRWNRARKAIQVIEQQDNSKTIRESWNNKDRVEWKGITKGNLVQSGSGTPKCCHELTISTT